MAIYILIFSMLAIVGILTYLLQAGQEQGVQKFHTENMQVLTHKYPEVFNPGTEYSFYTTGHPYVWVSINYQDALKHLVNACRGHKGIPIAAVYSLKIDEDRKHVYLVCGIDNFNFSKLMHYDEWLLSNSEIAKNIAAYKNLK